MKCAGMTSRWGVKPCPNNAKCDGYCYAHHPSVVLAKLRLYERAPRKYPLPYGDTDLTKCIEQQERLLKRISPSAVELDIGITRDVAP